MTTPNTPTTDAEFDTLQGGRELLPIEQVAYEAEGAERFAKFHGHGRTFPKNAEFPVLTEADREEIDMEIHRWKQSGGPARDNQARAEKLDLQWSEAARLGGMLS